MSDKVTPITTVMYNREIGSKLWHWNQIYFGPDADAYVNDGNKSLKRYVPEVGDIIAHTMTGDWVVESVDENYIPALIPRTMPRRNSDIADSIIIPSKAYSARCDVLHVDTTVTPIRFYINSRVYTYNSTGTHYKIFKGIVVGDKGLSIGSVIDANGKIVSDSLDLELVAFSDMNNQTIKTFKTGYLRELPLDGDTVTIAVYAKDGSIIDTQTLIVSHSNFIPANHATKYVTDIRIDSPFLSENDDTVIEVKRNLTLSSLSLFAIVTYNDNSQSQRLPVGGDKFKLLGADAFTATNDLQEIDVTLVYNLADDEGAINTTGTKERKKTKKYTLRTMPSDAAYSVKLFVIPVWNSKNARWTLRYKLYDLRRESTLDVTDLVEENIDYKFNPNLYNQKQTVQVAINLMNVGPQYQFYRPPQMFYITLIRPGENKNVASYYQLSYSSNTSIGNGLMLNKTSNGAKSNLDISCGQTSVVNWLNQIYNQIGVIYVGDTPAPPQPTKFRLKKQSGSSFIEYPIDKVIGTIESSEIWTQGETAVLEFFSESGGDTIELGSLGLNVNVVS